MAAENPLPPPSSDTPPELESLTAGVNQMHVVLSHATEVAGDLSRQLGATASSGDIANRMLDSGEAGSIEGVLDRQLEEIDKLLQDAKLQVGSASSETKAHPAALSTNAAPEADAVPDFMREFTDGASGAPVSARNSAIEAASSPAARTASSADPDYFSEFRAAPGEEATKASSGSSNAIPRAASATARQAPFSGPVSVPASAPPNRERASFEKRAVLPQAGLPPANSSEPQPSVLARVIGTPLNFIVQAVLLLLEILDAPFRRLSRQSKDVMGWIALATLAVALIVSALAFL